jgi:hypothetical protein
VLRIARRFVRSIFGSTGPHQKALSKKGNAIIDEHGEEPEDEAVLDRFYEIQERIADLSEGEETWPEEAKANAGAVIGIGHDGAAEIRRGLIRPEDKAAARKADKAGNAADNGKKGEPAAPCFSAALIEDLTAHRRVVRATPIHRAVRQAGRQYWRLYRRQRLQ